MPPNTVGATYLVMMQRRSGDAQIRQSPGGAEESPADLAGASVLQFTRRYLDQPASVAPNGGWESTPGNNHVMTFQPPPAP